MALIGCQIEGNNDLYNITYLYNILYNAHYSTFFWWLLIGEHISSNTASKYYTHDYIHNIYRCLSFLIAYDNK